MGSRKQIFPSSFHSDDLFMSYSFPIHVFFISFSLRIQLPCIPIHFLFTSYSFPISFLFIFTRFFSCPWIKIRKSKDLVLLTISLFKKQFILQPQINWERGLPHKSKKRLTKWVVKKVWGLDGQPFPNEFPVHFPFMSYSFLIHFPFMSYSFPIYFSSFHFQCFSNSD